MKILKDDQYEAFLRKLQRRSSPSGSRDAVRDVVQRIIHDVRKQGDRAVRRYTEKFDGTKLKRLSVSQKEIALSAAKVDVKLAKVMRRSAQRIKTYHKFQKEDSWYFSEKGITLGQIVRPLERVGVYVPGGKASYPSSVLMNVIPAQIAGVREVVLCVPTPDGGIDPSVAAAIRMLGVSEVYRIGGAQAIAALAYGTATVRRVDKIVGPGNMYVAAAKRMVFGDVGVDLIAGPSEVLIIADKSARPSFIAADLLSQAEHDEMASSILMTDSIALAEAVQQEIRLQINTLLRKEIARKSLARYGAIIVTKNAAEMIRLANNIAPEHLEIMTTKPAGILSGIKNAGAIFVGQWTPETIGDYGAGPNHTLPTGGTARFSSPLGVYDFMKRTSLLNVRREGFVALSRMAETFADKEGLQAHGNTIRVRRG